MTTIGFVGLGRMGLPMAANLLKGGFAVVGCDLDPRKDGGPRREGRNGRADARRRGAPSRRHACRSS